uniref:Uncharacterized protein n=1 Tax=Sipha flava TaxID=143950 RepID=A0A2S2QAU4_9HEMI
MDATAHTACGFYYVPECVGGDGGGRNCRNLFGVTYPDPYTCNVYDLLLLLLYTAVQCVMDRLEGRALSITSHELPFGCPTRRRHRNKTVTPLHYYNAIHIVVRSQRAHTNGPPPTVYLRRRGIQGG